MASGEAADSVLAALAGFFIWGSCQPPPPGLPTLRSFQEGQGLAAVAWLRHRTRAPGRRPGAGSNGRA